MAMGADYSFELIFNETCAPQFNGHNNSFIASVLGKLNANHFSLVNKNGICCQVSQAIHKRFDLFINLFVKNKFLKAFFTKSRQMTVSR
jgi:hypothetical protein